MLVEDVDYSSSFCYPPNDAFEQYKALHTSELLLDASITLDSLLLCSR
jgi:hypothetical protein